MRRAFRRPRNGWTSVWLGAVALTLSACATYHPVPLPTGPDLARAAALRIAPGRLRIPGLKPHPVRAAKGLDVVDVVILAVVNNPELKAERLRAGVARAELLQAGLLPDPQLSASFTHPSSGPPPLTDGHELGLSQALRALVTRSTARAGAQAHRRQVNLQILWREWQVARQARQLFIRVRAEDRLGRILGTRARLDAQRYARDRTALQKGILSLSTVSADLANLLDAQTRLRQLQRRRNESWHALDALLGLVPGTVPTLRGSPDITVFTAAQFRQAVRNLPRRRPDLLALQAGYHSQEEAVRRAILEQFPAFSVGLTRRRDTGDVSSAGFGVTLTLPLFNRNQGHIAIQRATRAALRQAYQARLDEAVNQAHALWQTAQLLSRQLHQLRARLPVLRRTAQAARRSFREGNLSAGTYISLRSRLLAERSQRVSLTASLQSAQAALETVLGMTLGGQ